MGNIQATPGTQLAIVKCPSDFEDAGNSMCRYKCPSGYKFIQEGGGQPNRCVYATNNSYSVNLQQVPIKASPDAFNQERNRFYDDQVKTEEQRRVDIDAKENVRQASRLQNMRVKEHDSIRAQYAGYRSVVDAKNEIKKTKDSLRPMRPPTQPYSDIEKERRDILKIVSEKLVIAQVALFTILICAAEYMLLPSEYSHKLAFLTLCVGLSVGIFLSRK